MLRGTLTQKITHAQKKVVSSISVLDFLLLGNYGEIEVLNTVNSDAFLEVIKLVLGEKLWEEKGKAIGMSVKSIGPEGVRMEQTFATEVRGFGRWPSGRNMGTVDIFSGPSGGSSGTGQGIFTSPEGDTVVWKAYSLGKTEAGMSKSVNIVQLMTTSQKLSWMNGLIAVWEGISDQKTMELSGTAYEWK
jgi:hypothetical protein